MIRSITRFGLGAAALMALATGASAEEKSAAECAQPKPANFQEMQAEWVKNYGKQDGVEVTATGLHYRVLRDAPADGTELSWKYCERRKCVQISGPAGLSPDKPTQYVTVHYKGTLVDGCKFDSSYDRDSTIQFRLNEVIPGWTEGLQLMKTGAKYEFVIPGDLAYGPRGQGDIPPNATLVFEVELFDVIK